MSKIVKKVPILGDKGEAEATVLFDSGAMNSVIRKEVAHKVSTILPYPRGRRFVMADGKTEVACQEVAFIMVTIDTTIIDDVFYVLQDLSRDIVLVPRRCKNGIFTYI